jgi:hypothetical protein
MTLTEQREKLNEAMKESMPDRFNLYFHDDELMEIYDAALIAISAAGLSIVGPEVTDEIKLALRKKEDRAKLWR